MNNTKELQATLSEIAKIAKEAEQSNKKSELTRTLEDIKGISDYALKGK